LLPDFACVYVQYVSYKEKKGENFMVGDPVSSRQAYIRQGAKGLAARHAGVTAPATGDASLRSAVRRVSGKADPLPGKARTDCSDPGKAGWRTRAAQAALGILGSPPERFDETALGDWVRRLSPDERRRLSRLLWAARQDEPTTAKPPFAKVERQLAQQGVHLDISAQTVNVTMNNAATDRPPRGNEFRTPFGSEQRGAPPQTSTRAAPRSRYRMPADWGRQWGRIKDFINGH
jgi:hypothetical protein